MRSSAKPLTALLALALGACGARTPHEPDAGPADAGGAVIIAMDSTFAGYQNWQQVVLPDDGAGSGKRTVYLNQAPPHGSTEFPVGTILVKKTETTSPVAVAYDAMVKRGGGFNSSGAVNWEWFGMVPAEDGGTNLLIQWRGVTPPVGMGYSGGRGGTCNDCHGHFPQQDYVQTEQYQLGHF